MFARLCPRCLGGTVECCRRVSRSLVEGTGYGVAALTHLDRADVGKIVDRLAQRRARTLRVRMIGGASEFGAHLRRILEPLHAGVLIAVLLDEDAVSAIAATYLTHQREIMSDGAQKARVLVICAFSSNVMTSIGAIS